MRALRSPDAWLVGDVALHLMLGLTPLRGIATNRAATERSLAWQPWRSYAVIRAWAGHHTPTQQGDPT
jgi:AraC family transcriptional regulator of adaptative response / DNA-3-methyladenine glycosylase II